MLNKLKSKHYKRKFSLKNLHLNVFNGGKYNLVSGMISF